MKISVLGVVGATADDGAQVDVGPAKCQAVLAALALSAGSAVPVWRLVESVWGEEPPRTAERTLQSYVARLRKGLGQDAIIRTGDAYRLNLPADSVDVVRFERYLDDGQIEEGLAEWTGTPLAGLDAPGLDAVVAGLTERWLGAVELDLERRVEDDPAAVIGRLTELTTTQPFREGLWALLMTALYRIGRQVDALAAYRTAREHLVEQLGVEPGPRLQELEMQILRHDEDLGVERTESIGATSRPTGTVTFGFTDIEGASRWWTESRVAMSKAMTHHNELVQASVNRHSGHVFSRGGDTFGVAFHTASSAAEWATQLQQEMESEAWPDGVRLRLRIAIHTGEAEEHEGGYFGPAVNVAASLSAAGHGGQTLVSAATANVLEGIALRDLGSYRLEDVVTEQGVFQLGGDEYPPLRIEDRFRGNLPRRLGRLIGRGDELETIAGALTTYPVVTLVGPGGIGKTRLALAAAGRVESGGDAWLIELADIASPDHVPHAVADTLGVRERPGQTLTRSIVETLQSREALLVLDNCEHLIEAAAELTQSIVQGCEHLRVLATSRERLGLTNERIVTVPPLDPTGSAVELFEERATAVSPIFDAPGNRTAVEEICRRLDGIPLAIELAAAATTTLSPTDLVERLEHRLRLLDGTRRTGADRHRTLRSAIQWSYDLLTPSEQTLFQRLSIFTGPFDLNAAETVSADTSVDPIDIDNMLSRLVEQSMLGVESGPFGRRFRLLDPIREFGEEHLTESGQSDLVAEHHAIWCLSEVTGVHRLLSGWDEIEGVARLTELWPNQRAAFDWACDNGDRELARALVRPILSEIVLRSNNEIGDWVERLLTITPADDKDGLVFGLYWAAHRYALTQNPDAYERLVERYGEPDHTLMHHGRAFVTGDYQGQADWSPKAIEELRRQGDDHLAERAEINVPTAWLNLGRYEECDARLEELLSRYQEQGPPTFINWALMLLGYSASFQGRQDQADAYFEEAIGIELPQRTYTPNKPLEARAAFRRGNRSRAFHILRSHIDELLSTDNMQAGSLVCIEFTNMMTQIGQLTEASCMLDYLETTGILDAPAWRSLIDDSAKIISSSDDIRSGPSREVVIDDRQALEYMREVLEQLADGQYAAG
ncbi:MAG: BTAD domain-containing putative transcriptional regulator [Actinomycetota bacterium]|nr:BTAD domain-containing putative transcriptional regulator [Actinomycetota bacterium]